MRVPPTTNVVVDATPEGNILIFPCPHCGLFTVVYEADIACAIFRHAAFQENNQQISPHLPKAECDALIESSQVVGCAKPFQVVKRDDMYVVAACDYI